jgi:hypothetical protein
MSLEGNLKKEWQIKLEEVLKHGGLPANVFKPFPHEFNSFPPAGRKG